MPDPVETKEAVKKAFLVGICEFPETPAEGREHLAELAELMSSLGVSVCGDLLVSIRERNPRFLVGSGKAEEIKAEAERCEADMVVFDSPLGPSQQRNLERLFGSGVMDRQEVILDIFAQRARTKEAVLQVELARSRYYLPRLAGAWGHLSRQRGGNTGARGDGEKQIEYDRRQLKQRIGELEVELAEVRKQRGIQRKNRLRGRIPNAAIVGYTNAGKSTLLNTLTGADAYAADKLFATLDPTTRKLVLPDRSELLLTDTVGFVRKLPHSLIEAFKSTLEEAVLADFILLVLDASSPAVSSHWETTLSVLSELGADRKDMIVIFNKMDAAGEDPFLRLKLQSAVPDALFVSCRTGAGLDALRQKLMTRLSAGLDIVDLAIPPDRSDLVAQLHSCGRILESRYHSDGTFEASVRVEKSQRRKLEPFLLENQNRFIYNQPSGAAISAPVAERSPLS